MTISPVPPRARQAIEMYVKLYGPKPLPSGPRRTMLTVRLEAWLKAMNRIETAAYYAGIAKIQHLETTETAGEAQP